MAKERAAPSRARSLKVEKNPICPRCKTIWGDLYPARQIRFRCPNCFVWYIWDKTPEEEAYDGEAWNRRAWHLISWERRDRRPPPRFRLTPHRIEDILDRMAAAVPPDHVWRALVCPRCDHMVSGWVPEEKVLFSCSLCPSVFRSPYVSDRHENRAFTAWNRRYEERRKAGKCPFWNGYGAQFDPAATPPPSSPDRE